MTQPQQLLDRLDAIGRSVAATGQALALIGVGSVGQERARLDSYSDLDFYVVALDGQKPALVADIAWLEAVAPVAYHFLNTPDGRKLLFADGIFCEYAVFDRAELRHVPLQGAQIVWQAAGFDLDWEAAPPPPVRPTPPAEWLTGEIMTNLYVGLGRYRRGERLSAARFIQGYAVDRIVELARHLEPEQPAFHDPFGPERRVEQRFPATAAALPRFMQGYDGSPASALAILQWLEERVPVSAALAAEIRTLADM